MSTLPAEHGQTLCVLDAPNTIGTVYAGFIDGAVVCWNTMDQTYEQLLALSGSVWAMSISSTGDKAYCSSGPELSVSCWHLETRSMLFSLRFTAPVTQLLLDEDVLIVGIDFRNISISYIYLFLKESVSCCKNN